MLPISLFLFAAVALAFCTYLGYGLVKLLVPRERHEHEGLFAPLLGYVFLLLVGYYSVRTVLNLRQALLLAAGLGTLLNGVALWLRRGERLHLNLRAHGEAYLLAAVAFLLGVLPLLSYGYITTIGENWDPENYLPVAEYLVRVPVKGIAAMPPSPLRDLNAHPPRIGLTLGFSIAQGMWQQLVGWDALRSFAPTLAVLRALTVLATYLLFRRTMRMERWGAFLATGLVCLHAQLLWLAFLNFGMQVSSLPLVPLGLVLLADAVRHADLRSVVATSVAVAAIPVSYYPALTVFVPMAAALGLAQLLSSRKWTSGLLAGLGAAAGSLLLAWGTVLDYQQGFAFRYSIPKTTLGLTRMIAGVEILGLTPFGVQAEAVPAFLHALQLVAAWGIAGLSLLALVRCRTRWLWLATVVPGALYLLWLRGTLAGTLAFFRAQGFPIGAALLRRAQPYPYAFMKGAVYVAPFFMGLGVQGLFALPLPRRRRGTVWATAAALGALLVGLVGWSCGRVIARYSDRPALFDQELLQVEQSLPLIEPGAPVYLTNRPERAGPVTGLLAYFLRDHPLRGAVSTGYSGMSDCRPGEAFPYALLDHRDNPYVLGLSLEDRVWQGGGMALYRRDPAQRTFLDLRQGNCAGQHAEPALAQTPLAGQLLALSGPCRKVAPDTPLYLYVGGESLALEPLPWDEPASGTLLLAWVSLAESPGLLHWDDGAAEELQIPTGFSIYRTPLHPSARRVEVTAGGPGQAALCWAAVREDKEQPGWLSVPRAIAFLSRTEAQDTSLVIEIRQATPEVRVLRATLEVWENTYSGAAHYAWWGPLSLPRNGAVQLRVDLAAREARWLLDGQAMPLPPHGGAEAWPPIRDGSYFVSLWIHEAEQAIPVAQFQVVQGTVQQLTALPSDPLPLYVRPLDTAAAVHFGDMLELVGYEFRRAPLAAGETLPVSLEWRCRGPMPVNYVVTLQVVGPGRLFGQVDVPLGGQGHPTTTWKRNETVREDLPLGVEPGAPRGHYRLIVAVYDPATVERLPVVGPEGQVLGDAVDLGEVIVRR